MRETILEIGRDLAVGQSIMAECPECEARKLSVTRYGDGLGWICFRASCGVKGAVTDMVPAPIARIGPPHIPVFKPRYCPYDLGPIEGYAKERLPGHDEPWPWATYSAGPDRMVFMLDNFRYQQRGWTSRTRDKRIDSGKLLPGPLYGYYNGTAGDPPSLWMVEDCVSAIYLADLGAAACALLGTNCSDPVFNELWDEFPNTRRVYVALDPGAEDAARKIVRKARTDFGLDAIQVPLPDDIHRLDQDTLTKLLEAYP